MKHAIHLYDDATDNYLGTVTAPAPRVTAPKSDDGGYRYTTRLTLPRGLTRKDRQQAARAAAHTMQWRCQCAHDCCGHTFGWSSARIVDARTLTVTTHVKYNI